MRQFFALAHDRFGDDRIPKADFQDLIRSSEEVQELFDWIDFSARKGLTAFGRLILKFDGRELGGFAWRAVWFIQIVSTSLFS